MVGGGDGGSGSDVAIYSHSSPSCLSAEKWTIEGRGMSNLKDRVAHSGEGRGGWPWAQRCGEHRPTAIEVRGSRRPPASIADFRVKISVTTDQEDIGGMQGRGRPPRKTGIVRHVTDMRKSPGANPPGIEPVRWEASSLYNTPLWPPSAKCDMLPRPQRTTVKFGFSRDLPFPPPLCSSAAPFSLHSTLIGSQDLVVKIRRNLSTQYHALSQRSYIFQARERRPQDKETPDKAILGKQKLNSNEPKESAEKKAMRFKIELMLTDFTRAAYCRRRRFAGSAHLALKRSVNLRVQGSQRLYRSNRSITKASRIPGSTERGEGDDQNIPVTITPHTQSTQGQKWYESRQTYRAQQARRHTFVNLHALLRFWLWEPRLRTEGDRFHTLLAMVNSDPLVLRLSSRNLRAMWGLGLTHHQLDFSAASAMEQRWNERESETGDPRENPPTNGIVRHDSHMRKSGVTRPGIEPGSPWWEESRLTSTVYSPLHCSLFAVAREREANALTALSGNSRRFQDQQLGISQGRRSLKVRGRPTISFLHHIAHVLGLSVADCGLNTRLWWLWIFGGVEFDPGLPSAEVGCGACPVKWS
ncbi:hypothetical protein PR048_028174 [Dryococelus australis]|uniref:Uncharacterized protein n=1 Tax=Dryococelus australis TaxID=614101 RepID=A0ABQ9GIK3_9NEOP|nr:hypothetical protein PR048_028174 [Dryococelus australis]